MQPCVEIALTLNQSLTMLQADRQSHICKGHGFSLNNSFKMFFLSLAVFLIFFFPSQFPEHWMSLLVKGFHLNGLLAFGYSSMKYLCITMCLTA